MSVNRGRFVLLAVGAIALLGLVGAYQLDPKGFVSAPLDYLYRVVQLFAAEGDWTAGHSRLPLALEIARFAAPIVTIASLIVLFAEGIWTALINARVRFYKNHIVVVGLSASAMELVRSAHQRKLDVVVIEKDPDNRLIQNCRSLLIPVLLGDAKHSEWLKRARVAHAGSLVSFVQLDDESIELSLRVQAMVEDRRPDQLPPLKVILKLHDMQLGSRLESYPKFFENPRSVEVRFFNLDALAARSLFREFYPEVYADAMGRDHVHIVVLGYGSLGKQVVINALKQAHYANDKPLQLTIVDRDALISEETFRREHPGVEMAAQVLFVPMELNAEALRGEATMLGLDDATMFVCTLGGDAANMSMAIALRQLALLGGVPNSPIFVALRHSRGLAQLVESELDNPEIPDGLYPFGMVEQLVRVDRVVNERLDNLAIALHENYLAGLEKQTIQQASHYPWSELSETFRNDARAQADHVRTKLRAAGYVLVQRETEQQFSESEVLRLAEIEKKRWVAERAAIGWTFGEVRSDLAKIHPGLKSWQSSSTSERAQDMASVQKLPGILQERLGAGIARQVVIGITGHRAHRLSKHLDYVEAQVRKEFEKIAALYPGAEFTILSALADGSDRLVAQLALETLDAQLVVALPLPYEIYKRSFGHADHLSNQASNEEFQRYVGRSSLYFEMPLRFASAQILEQDNAAGEQARAHQYALAGAYIVSRSDELIAVWDGQDARGTGGTAEVVQWREQGWVPAEFAFGNHFFPAVAMSAPRVISIPPESESLDAPV